MTSPAIQPNRTQAPSVWTTLVVDSASTQLVVEPKDPLEGQW